MFLLRVRWISRRRRHHKVPLYSTAIIVTDLSPNKRIFFAVSYRAIYIVQWGCNRTDAPQCFRWNEVLVHLAGAPWSLSSCRQHSLFLPSSPTPLLSFSLLRRISGRPPADESGGAGSGVPGASPGRCSRLWGHQYPPSTSPKKCWVKPNTPGQNKKNKIIEAVFSAYEKLKNVS